MPGTDAAYGATRVATTAQLVSGFRRRVLALARYQPPMALRARYAMSGTAVGPRRCPVLT
eukprot:2349523-Rhodomonas_salina.3